MKRAGLGASLLVVSLVLGACGGGPGSGAESASESHGGGAATNDGPESGAESAAESHGGGAASDDGSGQGAGLCVAVTEELAVEVLGGPVAEPQSGDVLPRPNGIYCQYALAADGNVNVEAQLKEMTREQLEAFAAMLSMDQALGGVGEVAFQRSSSIMGLPGVSIAAWADGRGVSVSVNAQEPIDAAALLDAAGAIAEAALAS